jgi:hypothetical protein
LRVNDEHLTAAAEAMVGALKGLGHHFVARGFAPNFVEQVQNATTALRDAIDLRAAQLGQRAGTTASIGSDADRALKLVRVIEPLVRPVIQRDPELVVTWETLVALPRRSARASAVAGLPPTLRRGLAGEPAVPPLHLLPVTMHAVPG